jgi:hypothetical protein
MKPAPTKRPTGRPPKFPEPSRPITVTQPARTQGQIASVDRDRARAIVKVTDAVVRRDLPANRLVEVVEIEPGIGVIIVAPSRRLRDIPWLKLVEVAPARYLLVVPTGTPVDSLEVALLDALDDAAESETAERVLLTELQAVIRRLRRGRKVSKAEILIVDTAAPRRKSRR